MAVSQVVYKYNKVKFCFKIFYAIRFFTFYNDVYLKIQEFFQHLNLSNKMWAVYIRIVSYKPNIDCCWLASISKKSSHHGTDIV